MSRRPRIHFVVVTCVVALLTLSACSPSVGKGAEPSSGASEAAQAVNAEALLSYVEAERATLPQIMAQYPGLYSEIVVDGSFEESLGDRGLPVGTYAVVWFRYTYANPVDWQSQMDALDGQRSTLDTLCETTLFPAMKAAGITGPQGVVYSYDDGQSEFGPMWTHSCSDY